jgi:hypothetical protein
MYESSEHDRSHVQVFETQRCGEPAQHRSGIDSDSHCRTHCRHLPYLTHRHQPEQLLHAADPRVAQPADHLLEGKALNEAPDHACCSQQRPRCNASAFWGGSAEGTLSLSGASGLGLAVCDSIMTTLSFKGRERHADCC